MINEIECEVIFNPPFQDEPCEKPWTYHWNDNGNEAGCDEFFETRAEAEIAMKKRMQQKNNVSRSFYCQRDIEGESQCTDQCSHCKKYYAPLK